MRARAWTVAGIVVAAVSVGVVVWVLTRPPFALPVGVSGPPPDWWSLAAPVSWTATGAFLLRLRPRNAIGALILFVGVCQALAEGASAYGIYGLGVADPHWPGAAWIAFLGSPLWIPGVLPMVSVLLAIYPDGRLPSRRWRLPTASACVGIVLLTIAGASGYKDVAPGPPPLRIDVAHPLVVVFTTVTAVTLLGGTIALWAMSIGRLVRSRTPERQQLAWLLCAVIPFFLLAVALRAEAYALFSIVVPVAIAVGILRYHMLGIAVVLRRALVYAVLTGVVVAVYLLVSSIVGSRLEHGAIPGVLAAALVAVGLTPLRERLQRGVDRLVYGDRGDPMLAVTRLGNSVAAPSEPAGLLPSVLLTVIDAVHAPGAAVYSPDGRSVAAHGSTTDGVDLALRVSGRDVGMLRVAARTPGELYTDGDLRLLAVLAPQVAVVLSALELAEALEKERDRVVAATRMERSRMRRDLHDGLGPSLSGVGLGLQALESALAVDDDVTAGQLLTRVREEAGTAVDEVRRILDDLRPAALDDATLGEALRRSAERDTGGVPTKLIIRAIPPLSPVVEAAAYRIAQEALTNVARHAGASAARLTLAADTTALRVEISDDGHGFAAARSTGVGLASMRHRAEALGGTFSIATSDAGTTVVATLPVDSGT